MTATDAPSRRDEAETPLDAYAIREAIRAEPGLVLDDAATIHALIAADDGRAGRKVTDLRGAMVVRLETRLSRLEETHRSVVAAAYENMSGAEQIHRAALAALTPTRFTDFLAALQDEIPAILGVEALRLCLEGEAGARSEGALVALAPGSVDRYMQLDRPGAEPAAALRATHPADCAEIFGEAAAAIRSEAAVRLDFGKGARPGMLVFGSTDARRFAPEQGADLILFFGGVIERAVRRWVA